MVFFNVFRSVVFSWPFQDSYGVENFFGMVQISLGYAFCKLHPPSSTSFDIIICYYYYYLALFLIKISFHRSNFGIVLILGIILLPALCVFFLVVFNKNNNYCSVVASPPSSNEVPFLHPLLVSLRFSFFWQANDFL